MYSNIFQVSPLLTYVSLAIYHQHQDVDKYLHNIFPILQ